MKRKKMYGLAVLGLAVFFVLKSPLMVLAFEPWSNVNGSWISADGKTVIKGAIKKGITITKYQNRAGQINWKQVAVDQISFAMVRLGYYEDLDPYFEVNITNAESVGLDTGVCFYGEALNVEEARKEARYVLDLVKTYKVSYPIAYDAESQYLLESGLTRTQITNIVNAFCQVIEEAGYKAVVFGSHEWLTQHIDIKRLSYDIWYSRYGMADSYQNRTLWRCTDSGKVNGITGSVCLEFSFEDYKETFPGTGWRTINGKEFYFENYRMVRNTAMKVGDVMYFFGEDGTPRLTK